MTVLMPGVKWVCRSYMSGTTNAEPDQNGVPWVTCYPALTVKDSEYQGRRSIMAEDLADYFNGGDRPQWLQKLSPHPEHEYPLVGTEGEKLVILGPMTLPPNDNGKLNWMQDESRRATGLRDGIKNFLLKGKVP